MNLKKFKERLMKLKASGILLESNRGKVELLHIDDKTVTYRFLVGKGESISERIEQFARRFESG